MISIAALTHVIMTLLTSGLILTAFYKIKSIKGE